MIPTKCQVTVRITAIKALKLDQPDRVLTPFLHIEDTKEAYLVAQGKSKLTATIVAFVGAIVDVTTKCMTTGDIIPISVQREKGRRFEIDGILHI